MNKNAPDPDQRKIIRLYAALGAGLVLSLVPFFVAAILSMAFIFGVLIAAYVLRTDADEDSLIANHMTFIIRTIWIGSFVGTLTITAASIYLFKVVDNTPLLPCIEHFFSVSAQASVLDIQKMTGIMKSCYAGYWAANIKNFMISGIMAAGPILLYFLIRYARGLSRAMGGYRVAKPLAWF